MKAKKLMVFMVLAMLVVSLAACGSSSQGSSNNANGSGNSGSNGLSGKIVAGGSSALQPLAAAAAKGFMDKNPGVEIQVQGGGSGTGLSSVANGTFDIGNSDIFAEAKSGIDASKLVDHKVAVVGMAAAVNPKAGVKNLSKQDLIKIFTGEVTNWKQVGGNDVKITLVNRPDGSGTRATFVKFALDGATPAEGITQDSSNTVKQIIEKTPGAIGYEAFSYFNGSGKMVKLSIDGVKATDQNVESGKYPVWAYEHMYTKGKADKIEQAYINYILSDEVQTQLLPKQGYIPATKMKVERDASGKVTKK
ncbi:MAG TPA: phosphate ABC transporter substrate-binding protein PstS family protein [Bacillales bacterium]|nr:phosphate ABC transporter substrate-binding protein PstS family protein [Bacillales bacterium]